jgi:hypothetical protein
MPDPTPPPDPAPLLAPATKHLPAQTYLELLRSQGILCRSGLLAEVSAAVVQGLTAPADLDAQERREIEAAELFDDMAHTSGRVDAIRAHYAALQAKGRAA